MTRPLIFTAALVLAAMSGAYAQNKMMPGQMSHKMSHKMAHGAMYMDMQEHEFYTPAQAKMMHYKSDTGHKLVKVSSMPAGAKPTDDKMPHITK